MASMDAQWLKTQFELHPKKTKADLARSLGLEAPAVSKILKGIRQIKAREYIIMREFFGLPVDGEKAVNENQQAYVVETLGEKRAFKDDGNAASDDWVIPTKIMEQHTEAQPDHVKNFRVGDDMMAPEFNRGEYVMVDTADNLASPPGAFIIYDGAHYMIRNCELITGSDPAEIRLSALKAGFQSQKIKLDGFQIVGRVIAKLQWL